MNVSKKVLAFHIVALLDRKPTKQVALIVSAYLVQHKQTAQFETLLHLIAKEYEKRGTLLGRITSARPLKAELQREIESRLKRLHDVRSVRLDKHVDPDLIGGLKVEALDTELDLSISSKLEALKSLGG